MWNRALLPLAVAFLFAASNLGAEGPRLDSEQPLVHPNVTAMETTVAGGACVAGSFLQARRSGSDEPGPAWDAVVDCYDAGGHLAWSLEGVNPSDAFANAVAVGPDGVVYVAGSFAGELWMGGDSLVADTFEVAHPPTPDLRFQAAEPFFLAAVDPSGRLRWLQQPFASEYQSDLWELSVEGAGLYAAGYTRGTLHLTESTVVPPEHVFLARYGSDGSVDWGVPIAHFPTTVDPVQPRGLVTDRHSGVWLLIGTTDSTVVGGITVSTGGLLLLHVGPDGTLGERIPINADRRGAAALAIGYEGELYVTGTYVDTLFLDEETWLPPALQEDRARVPRRFFLARYESDGRLAWARHATDEKWSVVFSEGADLTVDEAGDVHVGMLFRGEMVLDGDTLSSLGNTSLQVAGYSPQGDRRYGMVLNGVSDGESALLATSARGDLFVVYEGTLYRYVLAEPVRTEQPKPHQATVQIVHFPDPATEFLQVRFTLTDPAHTRITVYDGLGRQVVRVLDRSVAAGEHRMSIPMSGLAPGRYFYRLEAGGESAEGSFAVVR